jgi:hypothetical protein
VILLISNSDGLRQGMGRSKNGLSGSKPEHGRQHGSICAEPFMADTLVKE